jgi:hypothetical protein
MLRSRIKGLKTLIFITAGYRPAAYKPIGICLKGRTFSRIIISPAFQAGVRDILVRRPVACGYEN